MRTARNHRWLGLIASALLLLAVTVGAQSRTQPLPGAYLDALAFRNIGPALMGGRIDDFAVLEPNPAVFYVGAATGGLWKTTNNGTTWDVLFDDHGRCRSRSATSRSPRTTPTWCGSAAARTTTARAARGATASTSPPTAAQTWKHMGLGETRHIARIVVDPVDHDVVYVAALGRPRGPSPRARRLQDHRRRAHLGNVLFVNERHRRHRARDGPLEPQGALRRHLPAAPRHLGLQRRRAGQRHPQDDRRRAHLDQAHGRHPVGHARPHRPRRLPRQSRTSSTRASSTRRRAASTAPTTPARRGGRCRRTTRGRCTSARSASTRPTICASTCSACQLHISDDGGKTRTERCRTRLHQTGRCTRTTTRCGSTRPTRITSSTATTAASVSLRPRPEVAQFTNMDLGQFYHVGYDMDVPYHVCGGLQDNYTWCGPSQVRSHRHRQRRLVPHRRRRRLRGRSPIRPTATPSTPSRRTATSSASIG